MTEPQRISDERLAALIAHMGEGTEIWRLLVELRDRRAGEAKGWECVRMLLDELSTAEEENLGPVPKQIRQAAREAGVELD